MPHSMTAFSSQVASTEYGDISCEIRSVNSRFLDLNLVLSNSIKHLEQDIAKYIKHNLSRGKVEVKLLVNANQNLEKITLNENKLGVFKDILAKVSDNLKDISAQQKTIDLVRLLQLPDLLINEQNISKEFDAQCKIVLEKSMQEFITARQVEGDKLAEFILQKAINAKAVLKKIELLAEDSAPTLKQKLEERLDKLNMPIDNERLAQEVAILVQKADIYEEIDRLKTHLIALENILQDSAPCGRKLDFLVQELQREANTLASKAHSVEINNLAIELKVLNEQIREQIQNLE